ncbi:MAG: glycosyltransferase [Candidatus Gracilibacteria bacterium]
MKQIKISVIMPVYNTEKYIGEAIKSILNQGFNDFEFIIIDDCSTDNSYKICKDYSEKDDRIKLYKNEKNIGVVKTRNKLLEKVSDKSNYIAIIDADDIARNDRLEKEYNFLENNEDYSIVGSFLNIIDETGKIIGHRKYPKNNKSVGKIICKKSPLAQPSVMIRKTSLEKVGNYNEDFERCQDYELWFRFFNAGFKIGNIEEELLNYRVFFEQGKSKHLKLTLNNTIKIQSKYIFKKKYFSISNIVYFYLEKLLLFLPNNLILWLFKILEYRKG